MAGLDSVDVENDWQEKIDTHRGNPTDRELRALYSSEECVVVGLALAQPDKVQHADGEGCRENARNGPTRMRNIRCVCHVFILTNEIRGSPANV